MNEYKIEISGGNDWETIANDWGVFTTPNYRPVK